MKDAPILAPKNRADLRRWLRRHHEQPDGVWLLIRKKDSTAPGVSYDEAVLEALCWGWIDSTAGRHDDDHYKVWYCPRKPKSVWSALNKRRIAELEREGLIEAPGRAAIALAKRNGAWDQLNASDALEVPKDLAKAFRANPPARRHWNAFPPGVRKQTLWWIDAAKRPETRAKRIAEAAELSARNVRPR